MQVVAFAESKLAKGFWEASDVGGASPRKAMSYAKPNTRALSGSDAGIGCVLVGSSCGSP